MRIWKVKQMAWTKAMHEAINGIAASRIAAIRASDDHFAHTKEKTKSPVKHTK